VGPSAGGARGGGRTLPVRIKVCGAPEGWLVDREHVQPPDDVVGADEAVVPVRRPGVRGRRTSCLVERDPHRVRGVGEIGDRRASGVGGRNEDVALHAGHEVEVVHRARGREEPGQLVRAEQGAACDVEHPDRTGPREVLSPASRQAPTAGLIAERPRSPFHVNAAECQARTCGVANVRIGSGLVGSLMSHSCPTDRQAAAASLLGVSTEMSWQPFVSCSNGDTISTRSGSKSGTNTGGSATTLALAGLPIGTWITEIFPWTC